MQWKKQLAAALAACFLTGMVPMEAVAAQGDTFQAGSDTCICEIPCGADNAMPEICGAYISENTNSMSSTGNSLPDQEITPVTKTSVGGLTVDGGVLGTDYIYDEDTNVLTIQTIAALTISGSGPVIVIPSGVTANLTLNGLDMYGNSTSPISVEANATLNLTLAENSSNSLSSPYSISGSLPAIHNQGTLTIDGDGTLRLNSSSFDASTSALIGGCAGESGGDISIHGGTFQIEDMDGGPRSNGLIGAGSNGSGGTVTITGGQFDFMGRGDGAFGDGIANTVTILGGYFNDADVNANTICGISVAPNYVGVEWINDSPFYTVVPEHYSFKLSGDSSGYTYENGILTLSNGADVTVSTSGVSYDRIVVTDGASATLTLKGADFAGSPFAIDVPSGSSLNLKLEGINQLRTHGQNTNATVHVLGSLTISGSGELTAISQAWGAAIGGSYGESSGSILINSGTIRAISTGYGAGIGGGIRGSSGTISIHGGTIYAISNGFGAGIGGGDEGNGGTIQITGGTVTAIGGGNSAGIGGGDLGNGGVIEISGGIVAATGSGQAAGIGGGHNGGTTKITISGGTVTATAPDGGAGIGSGGSSFLYPNGGVSQSIVITGGQITSSSESGAGIGGGSGKGANAGNILISGGMVTSTSQTAFGIGSGSGNSGQGTFSTTSEDGKTGTSIIFASSISDQTQENSWSGLIFQGQNGNVYGSGITLETDLIIPDGYTLTIPENSSLTIANGVAVINNGTITAAQNPALVNQGILINNGTVPADISGNGIFADKIGETVTIQQGDKTVSVTLADPNDTVTPSTDGTTVILPSGSTVQSGSGPQITVTGDGAAISLDGSISLPGKGSITVIDGQGNATSVTIPEGGGTITPAENGTVTLPGGSIVQIGNGPQITLDDKGGAVSPDGSITLPGNSSVTIPDDQRGTTTITVPENGATIAPTENGSVTLPGGAIIQVGSGPEITVSGTDTALNPEGGITLPNGGSITITSQDHIITTVTIPDSGGTVVPNPDGTMALPGGAVVQTGTENPVTIPDGGGVLQPDGEIRYTVTVRFDSQGGSDVTALDITVGSVIPEPEKPVRDGYSFTGWYQDAACTILWDFHAPATADLVLYAGWSPLSSGTGSGGGGSSSSGTVSGSGNNVTVSAVSGSVTATQMAQAVNKADHGAVITIQATSSSTTSLPAGGLSAAAGNDNDVQLNLRLGSITLPAAALSGLTDGLSSNERIEVSITRLTSGTNDAISVLFEQGAPVFEVTVTIEDTEIHRFDGPLTITLTISNLIQMDDPHVLHLLSDGSQEYYAPSQISGNQITVSGIRSLSVFAVIPGSMVPQETVNPFVDISDRDYFYEAVLWAAENGITSGSSQTTFGPDLTSTRAQMVTFLWRAAGSPAPVSTVNPFQDVTSGDYYYEAVLWAVENGITAGASQTTFDPNATVTRGQAVTFLYRAAGSPSVSGSSFGDVPPDAYYAGAVAWAASQGIASGTDVDTFSPNDPCTRAQIVTFLFRSRV